MGQQTAWGAAAPSNSAGFQEAVGGMIFFLAGLVCVATAVLPNPGLPFALLGSVGCFAVGLILSGHAWRWGAQPRSLCVAGTVLCALALIAELGFIAFAFLVLSHIAIG